ncbi:MAG: response regulator transcription factor [Leptolyngbyaceae cyanobacterium SL_7_1]|nr:response regulator transcription factor [Leptolyngbyaceae cyanobacterium SL_7_1]
MQIILIEDDPIFRSGLRVWLNQLRDVQVQAEFDTGTTALAWLESNAGRPRPMSINASK